MSDEVYVYICMRNADMFVCEVFSTLELAAEYIEQQMREKRTEWYIRKKLLNTKPIDLAAREREKERLLKRARKILSKIDVKLSRVE